MTRHRGAGTLLRVDGTNDDVRRGVGYGAVVGLVVAIVAIAVGISIIAMPLFALAQIVDGDGVINDPFLRNGLLRWAVPFGLLLGAGAGTIVGVWAGKGGRLPE